MLDHHLMVPGQVSVRRHLSWISRFRPLCADQRLIPLIHGFMEALVSGRKMTDGAGGGRTDKNSVEAKNLAMQQYPSYNHPHGWHMDGL
jgi:hypothetical protein